VAFYVIGRGGDPQKVYAMVGGLDAWEEAGYPITKGTNEG